MNNQEILLILKGQKKIMSMIIQDIKKEKWYIALLESAGSLDIAIKNLENFINQAKVN